MDTTGGRTVRGARALAAAVALLAVVAGCGGPDTTPTAPAPGGTVAPAPTDAPTTAPAADGRVSLTPDQRRIADQLVSVFENSSTEIRYDFVEDLGDGRGYTAGRAGFCTACGDMVRVVERYTDAAPGNPLARYLPALRELAADGSDAHTGLAGLPDAWRTAAADPAFRQAQDALTDELYFAPALERARQAGVHTPLGVAILYDTAVQHGPGPGPDSLTAILERTAALEDGDPASGVDETSWLDGFLTVRRGVLENPSFEESTEEWRESVGRVDALRQVLDDGNLALQPPVTVDPFGQTFVLS